MISSCYRDAFDKLRSIDGEDESAQRPDGWIVLRLVMCRCGPISDCRSVTFVGDDWIEI
jgi:hypothetical protein